MNEYYTEYTANAHRGDYTLSYKVDTAYEQSRNKIAKFINALREEIIFTSGATEGLNIIARGFFENLLEPGDEILITKTEHASNILPWFRLARKNGVIIKYIDCIQYHIIQTHLLFLYTITYYSEFFLILTCKPIIVI